MKTLWTIEEIIKATGGILQGTPRTITGVTTDSRTLQAGDMFIALAETRDGHDFVPAAHKAGAALSLVSRVVPDGGAQLVVPDTLRALEKLGVAARERAKAKRVAVTGSVGKTSVTRAIEMGLARAGAAHGPVGSFNNHIGVPLTLSRMPAETQRAVFEIGMNHPGEITPLTKLVQPHVVIITTVGGVHAEHFPDGEEGIARAKAEIFAGFAPGGVAILNRDNKWFELLSTCAAAARARVVSFGEHPDATLRLISKKIDDNGLHIVASRGGREIRYTMPDMGEHWALNSLGVLLVLEAADVAEPLAIETVANLTPLPGRGLRLSVRLGNSTYRLIDDAYNANPLSMKAGLANLGNQKPDVGGRRIAVVTDMLELGNSAPQLHAELAQTMAEQKVDLVFCAGPLMKNLWDALPAAKRGGYAPNASELAPQVKAAVKAGDVVLAKGSKGSKASHVVDVLLDRQH